MRLIDADELEKVKFHPLPYTHITPTDAKAESYERGWNDAIDAIMSEADTIEERKKGKWISDVAYYDEDGCPCIVYRCNQCGEVSECFDFCPNCGADMRGEK